MVKNFFIIVIVEAQKQVAGIVASFITPEIKERLEAAGFSAGVDVNLTVKRFSTQQDIMDYVGSD